MNTTKLRVLVIAEAANPEWVSVPLVGWNIAVALSKIAEVHIVTQVRNREAFLARGMIEGQDFTAIDTEDIAAPANRLASLLRGGAQSGWTTVTALQSLTYPVFEKRVWKHFRDRIERGEFDLVHRITPLSPTAAGSLASRCARTKVPFVIGPLNGGLPWPPGFSRERMREKEWLSYIRKIYRHIMPIRGTYRAASAVIAGSLHTASEVAPYAIGRTIYIPENGVDGDRMAMAGQRIDDILKLCFVGRLVPYKNADIAIRASCDLLRLGKAHFDIVGDGPERARLVQIVQELGISDRVTFHGWRSHSEVAAILGRSDLLVFPSIREFGGGVVLEAMAAGTVPVVASYGGPAELVCPSAGFAVPIAGPSELERSFRTLLNQIGDGQHDLESMSRSALDRIRELYTWDQKAVQIHQVYEWCLSPTRPMPDFGFIAASKNLVQS
ncbi:glycosyltransferase family 4 protein [Novosphingobium sp.]|uniref:glycosyltransferase family 4 protein n=1 Tax=Novosphingobium sp. TaxID=1874826 RepID=UPI003B52AB3E